MALSDPVTTYTTAMAAVGGVAWKPVFEQLAIWLKANATVAPVGLVAPPSGGVLTGAGTVTASTADPTMLALGTEIAKAVLSKPGSDPGVIAAAPKWASFAKAVVTAIIIPGQVQPGTLSSTNTTVNPGVVTGKGLLLLAGPAALTAAIISGIPVTDTAGQAAWLLPATQILLWLVAATEVVPNGVVTTIANGGVPVGTFKLN